MADTVRQIKMEHGPESLTRVPDLCLAGNTSMVEDATPRGWHAVVAGERQEIIAVKPETQQETEFSRYFLVQRTDDMEQWEVPASLGPTQAKDSVNQSCEKLECYMILTDPEKTAIGSICFLAGPVTLLENALVLSVIATTASLRQRPSYLFIGSLALADVFASCFFTTSFLDFHLFRHSDGPTAYLFKLGGVTMAFTSSVGSLLLTALDRYLCIHKASSYKVTLTRRRALLSMLALWGATIFISFLPLLGWRCPTGLAPPCSRLFPYINQGYLACWTSCVLVLLALILVAYALILWKAHRHESSMTSIQGAVAAAAAGGPGHNRMRMDIRLARTFGLILLILVGCWLPALSFMLADVAVVLDHSQQRAFAFCSTLCLVNSAVNPLLYALRCRELRVALLELMQRLCEKGRCGKARGPTAGLPSADNNFTAISEDAAPQFSVTQLDSCAEVVGGQLPDIRS